MVQEWTLCIQVTCYPSPRQETIEYVLCNIVLNKLIHRKREIRGTTSNNEAYYIALIEGLKITKMYRANGISVYTNSELVCSQMKGIYQVRKGNLKPLHVEARTIVGEFHFFTINHHSNINRISVKLLVGEMSTPRGGMKNEMESTSVATNFRLVHCYTSSICVCFFVVTVLVSLMVWLFQ